MEDKVCCAFYYSNSCFLKNGQLLKKKKKKHYEDFREDGIESNIYMTESGNHSKMRAIVLFLFFPSSLKSAIWNTVPLKYNRATDGCDV